MFYFKLMLRRTQNLPAAAAHKGGAARRPPLVRRLPHARGTHP